MRLISSKATGLYKSVAIVVLVGLMLGILLFLGNWLIGSGRFNIFDGLFPLALALFGYFIHTMVIDGCDEVWDDGQSLVFKRRGTQARIDLRDIESVRYSKMRDPPLVTLSLRTPTIFGTKIFFWAPHRGMPFSRSSIIDELIERIEASRTRGAV
jgi:hypothetical protein